MSRRLRDLLLGLVLALVTFAGVLWQVDRAGALRQGDGRAAATTKSQEQVSLPRLICPLH